MATVSALQILGAGAVVAAGALAYGSLVERRAYALRRVTVPVLEAGSADIRVLHLSDLHLAPWQKSKTRWVADLARLQPDVIVDTGDNLGHAAALPALRDAFGGFAGTPGVFVNGSNDYFAPEVKNPFRYLAGPSKQHRDPVRLNTPALEQFLGDDLGWTNLNNTAARVTVGGRVIEFFGVDDPHRHFDRLDDMRNARASLPGRFTYALRVGVTHAPYRYVIDALVDEGAQMVFAGHTHGGQVCVPGFGALVTNCDLPRSMAKGLSSWSTSAATESGAAAPSGTAFLHVSAGLGTSIYAPVRFACRPEATLLTLTAGK